TPSAATGPGVFNYHITYTTATNGLVVNVLDLTVTGISGTDQTYNGGTSNLLSGTPALSSNYRSGDDVSLNGTGVGTLASANAGSERVTVTGYGISGADAGNYAFAQPIVASVAISPEAITIAATNQTHPYGFG